MVDVPVGHAAVLERRGRYHRVLPAGRHRLLPVLDRVLRVVDLRRQERDVPPFVALDREKEPVTLGLRLAFTVKDPVAATYEIAEVAVGVEQLAVASARNAVGHRVTEDVLVGSGALAEDVRDVLAEAGVRWGVAVDRVDVTTLSRGPSEPHQ